MNFRDQSGMSVTEVIVASGLLGILAMGLANVMGNGAKSAASIGLKMDKSQIGAEIGQRVECPDFSKTTVCKSAGELVDVKDENGNIVVSKNGTKLDRLH